MEIKDILKQREETHGDYSEVAKTAQYFKSECKKQPRWKE